MEIQKDDSLIKEDTGAEIDRQNEQAVSIRAEQEKLNADAQALFDVIHARTVKSKVSGEKWLRLHLPEGMEETRMKELLNTAG